jgi:hypothetical protein
MTGVFTAGVTNWVTTTHDAVDDVTAFSAMAAWRRTPADDVFSAGMTAKRRPT